MGLNTGNQNFSYSIRYIASNSSTLTLQTFKFHKTVLLVNKQQ